MCEGFYKNSLVILRFYPFLEKIDSDITTSIYVFKYKINIFVIIFIHDLLRLAYIVCYFSINFNFIEDIFFVALYSIIIIMLTYAMLKL